MTMFQCIFILNLTVSHLSPPSKGKWREDRVLAVRILLFIRPKCLFLLFRAPPNQLMISICSTFFFLIWTLKQFGKNLFWRLLTISEICALSSVKLLRPAARILQVAFFFYILITVFKYFPRLWVFVLDEFTKTSSFFFVLKVTTPPKMAQRNHIPF